MLGDKKIQFVAGRHQNRTVNLQTERNLGTKDFEVIKNIGKGTFGIVRKVRCKRDGKIYAIKSIPL